MAEQEKNPERNRRDWIIILIILLIGFLCVILAGERAIRFSPTWRLDTDMGSNIDPNSIFLTSRPSDFFEPLDPSILTQPVWINVFLTPDASSFPTSAPSTPLPTNTPLATNTAISTIIPPTNTLVGPTPTNTFIYIPPPPTNTPKPPPIVPVDFSITKTDGITTYIPGSTLTYTVVVTNNGSVNVNGVTVSDTKPSQVTTWGWCVAPCTPTANTSTNLNTTVNLAAGNSITYSILANIDPGATGDLVNTASVSVPSGYIDTNNGNSSATDTDVLITASADLSITKDDGVGTYTPGGSVVYTIVVSNAGPNAVTGGTVTDTFDTSRLNTITWTCAPAGGASCTAGGSGNINDTVNMPVGSTLTYTVNANVNGGAAGNLVNTASVDVPAGTYDPDTSNNSATDTDTLVNPSIDLSITKTDGSATYSPGDTLTYTIIVTNNGLATASGFNITDSVPLLNNNLSVSCTPGSGSDSCGTNNTSGTNVAYNNATLTAGQTLTITITGRVSLWQIGPLNNTANIVIPGGAPFTDPNLSNNSATDTNNATMPTCDVTIDVAGTGTLPPITNGLVTCLRFTSGSLPEGADISLSNTGTTYLRWYGKDANGPATSCGVWQGLLWIFGNTLNNIFIDRTVDIILYAQALSGNDTLSITAINSWDGTVCP